MKYLLDTTTCIDYLRGDQPSVRDRLYLESPDEVAVSVITAAELRYGAEKSARPAHHHAIVDDFLGDLDVLPLEEETALHYGTIRRRLEREGRVIGPNDLLIAAHALTLELTLVTSNTAEFERVRGLHWEDWRAGL